MAKAYTEKLSVKPLGGFFVRVVRISLITNLARSAFARSSETLCYLA